MSMIDYDVAVREFGADKFNDKNGKPMKGLPLNTRYVKLVKERDALSSPKITGPIEERTAIDPSIKAFNDAAIAKQAAENPVDPEHDPRSAPAVPVDVSPRPGDRANPLPTVTGRAYEIDRDVPAPAPKSRARNPIGKTGSKYPYAQLEIGDSFFVPMSASDKQPWRNLAAMSSRFSKDMFPKKFTTARTYADPSKGTVDGCRTWRVADLTERPAPRKRKSVTA